MKDEMSYCSRNRKKYDSVIYVFVHLPFSWAPQNIRIRHRTQPSIFMQIFDNDFQVFGLPLMLSLCALHCWCCVAFLYVCLALPRPDPINVSKYFSLNDWTMLSVDSNVWRFERACNCFRISLRSNLYISGVADVNVKKWNEVLELCLKKNPVWSSACRFFIHFSRVATIRHLNDIFLNQTEMKTCVCQFISLDSVRSRLFLFFPLVSFQLLRKYNEWLLFVVSFPNSVKFINGKKSTATRQWIIFLTNPTLIRRYLSNLCSTLIRLGYKRRRTWLWVTPLETTSFAFAIHSWMRMRYT